VKFIVLTYPRTGSTLLCNLLDNHPMIRCYGEILHDKENTREKELGDRDDKTKLKELHNQDIKAYMASLHYHPTRTIIGYKIMYDHLTPKVTEYLKDTNIKIIHLTRNLLETYVSRQRSIKYKIWHLPIGAKELPDDKLIIDPKDCETYFNHITSNIEKHHQLLESRDIFKLDYEQLNNKLDQTTQSLYKFLNVPYHKPLAKTKKSENKTMEYRIINYESLWAYFQNTKYNYLFK
jgi:LPS sulfotransferase NodH